MPKAKPTARDRQFNQLQAALRSIHSRPPQVDEPPEIARLALLNFLPDLVEKVAINHAHAMDAGRFAMEAATASKEAAWAASKSSKDFTALVAWLRSIGSDADYLGLMEKTLRDRLNHII